MSEITNNPFLEGSEEVPGDEAKAAAEALAQEAAAIRSRASDIKERAEKARAEKEAAAKLEAARIKAEIEAARSHVIKTVSNIPKASEKPTIRPAPPPFETLASSSDSTTTRSFDLSGASLGLLILDFVVAATAITFTFLLFKDMGFTLK